MCLFTGLLLWCDIGVCIFVACCGWVALVFVFVCYFSFCLFCLDLLLLLLTMLWGFGVFGFGLFVVGVCFDVCVVVFLCCLLI